MNDRWNHLLLVILLLAQLLLLATDPRAQGSPFERFVLRLLAPIGHVAGFTADATLGFLTGLRSNRELRQENRELRREFIEMRRELVRLHGLEEELERLSRATRYQRPATGEVTVGDVIFIDEASWLRTLVLYAGMTSPRRNQPILAAQGLVGRIITAAGSYAKVQLITDRSSSVSAMIERTRRKGIAQGAGSGLLELEYIPLQADVEVGDRIVTAGIDGIFPRGIPVGRITNVEAGQDLFHRIEVVPAVDFRLLDQVYILTQEVLPSEIQEQLADEDS